MCIAPNMIADGTQVACRECWQCRLDRVDDLVGRGIAEMRTAVAAHTVSLTYGRGRDKAKATYGESLHERAVLLTYSDVQKFMKLLRRHGYPCRFLVAGEYGSRKGRAHWHIILFWQERVPHGIQFEQNWWFQRFDQNKQPVTLQNGEPAFYWPHGHTYWKPATYESFRYNLKYVLKEQGQAKAEAQNKMGRSKEPPLGTEYFMRLARRYAEEGLAPRDATYTFPEAVRNNGQRVEFRLRGLMLDRFVGEYVRRWGELRDPRDMPHSDLVEDWLDARAPARPLTRAELVARRKQRSTLRPPMTAKERYGLGRWEEWEGWEPLSDDEAYRNDYIRLVEAVHRDSGRQIDDADEWARVLEGRACRYDPYRNGWVYESDRGVWLWTLNKEGAPDWQKLVSAEQREAEASEREAFSGRRRLAHHAPASLRPDLSANP